MTRVASWLAVLYVALLPIGRSGLPLNAQWGDLLFPLLVVAALPGGAIGRWWRREDWPLAAFLVVTLAMSLISAEPLTGLKQVGKQAYVASVFLVFRQLTRDASLVSRLQKTFVVVMAAVTAVSIMVVFLRIPRQVFPSMLGEARSLPLFGVVRRLRGGFEAPELLGNALLVAFVLALALRAADPRRSRFLWTAIATLLAAGEFLTYSHSVSGFCVAAVLFLFSVGSVPSRALRSLAWAMAIAVVVVVNAASVVAPRPEGEAIRPTHYEIGPVSLDLLGMRVEGQLMSYAALKQVAWSAFLDHPLTGVGPGRFMVETERAFAEGRLTRRYRSVPPHCDLTGRLAETGLLGGLSLLLLWVFWLRGIQRTLSTASPLQRAAGAAIVGILVNSVNADVMNFRFLWVVLAWASLPTFESTQTPGPSPTGAMS